MARRRPRRGLVGRTTAVIGLVLAGTLGGTATGAFMLEPEDPPLVPPIAVGQPQANDVGERPGEGRAKRRSNERGARTRRHNERPQPGAAEHAPTPGAPVRLPPAPPTAVAAPTPAPEPQPEPEPAAPPTAAPAPPADDVGGDPDGDADDRAGDD